MIIDKLRQHRIIVGTIVFLLLLIAVPVTVTLLGQQQETRSRAAGEAVTVKLTPLASGLEVGQRLDIAVTIDGKQNDISAVDITISYPPTLLELVSDGFQSGGSAPTGQTMTFSTITNDTDTAGSVHYVGVNPTSTQLNGSDIYVGHLVFNARAQGTATVGFSKIHINASGVSGALPIDTTKTIPGTYTITQTSLTTTPPATSTPTSNPTTPTPTPLSIEKRLFDFNDDGAIDEIDLNLMLSSFKTREGD